MNSSLNNSLPHLINDTPVIQQPAANALMHINEHCWVVWYTKLSIHTLLFIYLFICLSLFKFHLCRPLFVRGEPRVLLPLLTCSWMVRWIPDVREILIAPTKGIPQFNQTNGPTGLNSLFLPSLWGQKQLHTSRFRGCWFHTLSESNQVTARQSDRIVWAHKSWALVIKKCDSCFCGLRDSWS